MCVLGGVSVLCECAYMCMCLSVCVRENVCAHTSELLGVCYIIIGKASGKEICCCFLLNPIFNIGHIESRPF